MFLVYYWLLNNSFLTQHQIIRSLEHVLCHGRYHFIHWLAGLRNQTELSYPGGMQCLDGFDGDQTLVRFEGESTPPPSALHPSSSDKQRKRNELEANHMESCFPHN